MNRGFAPPLLAPGGPARSTGPPALPAPNAPRPSGFAPGGPGPAPAGARPPFAGSNPAGFSAAPGPRPGFSGSVPPMGPSSQGPRPANPPLSGPQNGADKKGPAKEDSKLPSKLVVNPQRQNLIQYPSPHPSNQPPSHSQALPQPPHLQHQPPHPQSHQVPPLPNMQGQKRFAGPPIDASEKKFRTSPPVHQPSHVPSLRAELNQKVNQTHPQDMAGVVCSAVTASCKEITDQFAIQLLEATFGNINRYLQPDNKLNLPMFADRVGAALRTELTSFFEKTFQAELVQLLLASTHQQPNVDALLRHKAMEIVHQLGDESTLNGMRIHIDRQARPPHPAQPESQFTPSPQAFQPPVQSFQPQQYNPQSFQPPPQQNFQQPPPHAQQPPSQQFGVQPTPFMPPVTAQKPISNPQLETQLCNAALSGELVTVQNLLRQGVNINASQEGGWTALMNATLQGHLPVVKTLIDERADLDLKDHGGFTALMYAASYSRIQIAEELVKAGANLDVPDNSGRNITHYANDPQIKAAISKGQQEREAAKAAPPPMPPAHMMPMGQPGTQPNLMGMIRR